MTTAARIDGTAIAREVRAGVARRVARLAAAGQLPSLAVILVGDDPASQVYVRNKVKACAEAGIRSIQENYPADLAEAALLARIAASHGSAIAKRGTAIRGPIGHSGRRSAPDTRSRSR